MNFLGHLRTINKHKRLVMKHCFKVGLYKQGLLHDLSKYSPSEFLVGVKYYQGDRSPNTAEREAIGYSSAWLHHKGRNRHHLEYWVDYAIGKEGLVGVPMPTKYIVEMFCDRVAACKNYNKEKYTNKDPYNYYLNGRDKSILHDTTRQLLEKLLKMLADEDEEKTFEYIRKEILHNKK